MILGFKTQINGKPTYFIEKIWSCLLQIDFDLYDDYLHPDGLPPQMPWPPSEYKNFTQKLHTFREYKKDKWKPEKIIDFFINVRTKYMFRFAPRIPVVSTQKVNIKYHTNTILVHIDSKLFYFGGTDHVENEFENYVGMLELAQNDGFDTIEDFFAYFNEDFTGKIIHWTDKQY